MASFEDLLQDRIDRLETIPERFINKIAASQDELFAELMEILAQLGLSDGSLTLDAANLQRVDALMQQYYDRLASGRYGALVNGYLSQLNNQRGLIDQMFRIDFDEAAREAAEAVWVQSRQTALNSLLGDDFKTNFINVVRDQVIQNVEARASFTELKDNLFNLFTETDVLPQMQRYASQVSYDLFSVADRSYSNTRANELGLEFGVYSGGLIKDSRPFCVERVGKYFHLLEVESWASIPQWKGRFRNTTPQNIIQWLGGYNCQHIFLFRSLRNVPKTVIERNIANGNYSPSTIEKELLGL